MDRFGNCEITNAASRGDSLALYECTVVSPKGLEVERLRGFSLYVKHNEELSSGKHPLQWGWGVGANSGVSRLRQKVKFNLPIEFVF